MALVRTNLSELGVRIDRLDEIGIGPEDLLESRDEGEVDLSVLHQPVDVVTNVADYGRYPCAPPPPFVVEPPQAERSLDHLWDVSEALALLT